MNFSAQQNSYDRDLRAIEPEMPGVMYWQGKPYAAQRNEIAETLLGGNFGYEQNYDFEILVRMSIYPAGVNPPAVDEAIEFQDGATPRIALRIKSVKPSQDAISWVYGVKADN